MSENKNQGPKTAREMHILFLTGDVEDKIITNPEGKESRINSFRLYENDGKKTVFIKLSQTPKVEGQDGWQAQWQKTETVSLVAEIHPEYGCWKSVEEFNQFLDKMWKEGKNGGKYGKVYIRAKHSEWYNKETKKEGSKLVALNVQPFFSEKAADDIKYYAEKLLEKAEKMRPTHHERDAKTGAPVNAESKQVQHDDDLPF